MARQTKMWTPQHDVAAEQQHQAPTAFFHCATLSCLHFLEHHVKKGPGHSADWTEVVNRSAVQAQIPRPIRYYSTTMLLFGPLQASAVIRCRKRDGCCELSAGSRLHTISSQSCCPLIYTGTRESNSTDVGVGNSHVGSDPPGTLRCGCCGLWRRSSFGSNRGSFRAAGTSWACTCPARTCW